MKKKLKIFLIVLTVIVLGAGSYLLYMFKFKEYDVADEEVELIVEDPYTIELPDGTIITLDGDEVVEGDKVTDGSETLAGSSDVASTEEVAKEDKKNESVAGTTTSGNQNATDKNSSDETSTGTGSTNSNMPNSTSKPANSNSTTKPQGTAPSSKPTVADVKGKYIPAFESLEAQADAKLNSLISVAKKEFSTKRANGESIDVGYFFNKYSGAASNLEANTDAVFNGVLNAVKADLKSAGYSPTYADSFSKDYEATKKARKDSIMNKALGR